MDIKWRVCWIVLLYVLTVDPLPYDEFDADKSATIDSWKELVEELEIDEFILRDNESST